MAPCSLALSSLIAGVAAFVGAPVFAEVPLNDDAAQAITVASGDTVLGTLLDATIDGSTSITSDAPDVWFVVQAGVESELRVDTCGVHDAGGVDSGTDTVLSVHTAAPGTAQRDQCERRLALGYVAFGLRRQ